MTGVRQGVEQRMGVGAVDGLDRAIAELGIDVALQGAPHLVGRALAGEAHLIDPTLADGSDQPLLTLSVLGSVPSFPLGFARRLFRFGRIGAGRDRAEE